MTVHNSWLAIFALCFALALNACQKATQINTTTSETPFFPKQDGPPVLTPTPSANPVPLPSTIVHIHPYLGTCTTSDARLCFITENPDGRTENYLYGGINGFRFEWGHRYALRVGESEGQLTLAEVISDQVARDASGFDLTINRDYVQTTPGGGCEFSLAGTGEFATANASICQQLRNALAGTTAFTGRFVYSGREQTPLLLTGLRSGRVQDWQSVRSSDLPAAENGATTPCRQAVLWIDRGGSYQWLSCGRVSARGQLDRSDAADLEARMSDYLGRPLLARTCLGTPLPASHDVYLRTTSKTLLNIWHGTQLDTCFFGSQAEITRLDEVLTRIKTRYAFSHEPAPTPILR